MRASRNTSRERGDDRVEVAQLFGIEQALLGQRGGIGDGLQLRVVQGLFATPLDQAVVVGDQVVGDAIQVGAAIAEQAAGGDFDDTQPGFLDDIIGVTALWEFATDVGVQRPIVGGAQLRDIRRFDRRGHGAAKAGEGNSPRRQGQRHYFTVKENHLHLREVPVLR